MIHQTKINVILFLIICFFSCENSQEVIEQEVSNQPTTAFSDAPAWAKEVIWYQIFVERFRNGDPTNDPTKEDIIGTYPGIIPENWAITPWTQDWYQPDAYFAAIKGKSGSGGYPIERFDQLVQLRRYGGDLQGVMDKLDYIDSLGVTAIYFNPLNDAPSLHKYDARNWRHIDRNFGPTPKEDAAIIEKETPDDPSTWQMTNADQLFVQVIEALHDRGIKVILDYSWNHTGNQFWALKDIQTNGQDSKFKDWYMVDTFDDPATPENELSYKGWVGIKELPEIKETHLHEGTRVKAYEGNLYSESVKQHIFNISKRWLDPNGDGDPSDGVDGFRLDVAAEVGLEFWRDYRKAVRSINPDAYLLGEIWWEAFPDDLLDPEPFLKGDVFDAVMNYRWYRAARHFFAEAPNKIPVSEFVDSLKSFSSNLRPQNNYVMMNLVSSHDVPRVLTSLFNKNKYKFKTKPHDDISYKIHQPDEDTYHTLRLLLIQQFTYVGAPHIWAGDEMGMWGSDDPDCRKPLIWPDYNFEPENAHPFNQGRPENSVKLNNELLAFYQSLIQLRKAEPELRTGDLEYLVIDDEKRLLAYSRFTDDQEVITVFNASSDAQQVSIPVKMEQSYQNKLVENQTYTSENGIINTTLASRSAIVIGN